MKKVLTLSTSMALLASMLSPVSSFASTESTAGKKAITHEQVRLLPTLKLDKHEAKTNAEKTHKKAIEITREFAKLNNISVKIDMDDKGYQSFVKTLGTDFDAFTQEELAEIISLVKFIDLYENYDQNEKIKSYKLKLVNGQTLSGEEEYELYSLMPTTAINSTQENGNSIEGDAFEVDPDATYYTYNRTAARDYAYEWASSRNNTDYPYYSNYYDCSECWNDCTNFVSQALKAGGMVQWAHMFLTGDDAWYYNNTKPSHSWGGAHNFYNHFSQRARLASSSSALAVGDAVNADFEGDGHIDHTAIVTISNSTGVYVTQHSSYKKDSPLSNWYSSGYKVYGWEMDNANYN
jgi:Putative amidase domain